jgi:diacylglycerol kinase (ATP)
LKNRPFTQRLAFAWAGLKSAWRSEASLRTQVLMSGLLLVALVILRPAAVWWALSGVMAAMVIAAELVNTALEHLADHLHPEQHPRVKLVKDCAAAAVLILSLAALWVAVMMVVSVV